MTDTKEDKKSNPRLLVIAIIVLAISAILLIIGLTSNALKTDEKVPASYQRQIVYPHTNETMYLRILLTSDTFGAQSTIKAETFLFPNHAWRASEGMNYSDLSQKYSVIFDGSGCPQATDSAFYGQISACVVPMEQVTERSNTYPNGAINYKGTNDIKFAQGGRYSVIVTDFISTDIPVFDLIQIEPISTTLDSRYFLLATIFNFVAIAIAIAGIFRKRQQPSEAKRRE